MQVPFTKMSACSNDYIYINCFENEVQSPESLTINLSDRHNGIGADGVILICPSEKADAEMRMYNRDGSEGLMCGNGIRCVAKFIYDNGIAKKPVLHIDTKSGIRECRVTTMNGKAYKISGDMGKAELAPEKVPVKLDGDCVVNRPVVIGDHEYNVTCVSMGNPHCVVFVPSVDKLDLEAIGPKFEFNPLFPERVNTEFVEVIDEKTIRVRVWERGSGETMACGTGACAAVVASTFNGKCEKGDGIRVILNGGDLEVKYTDERVLMTGGADTVYNGIVEV